MSYNISNSGKSISVTPFAHYRFDNLDTNLVGSTISAVDDQSGNNRHLETESGVDSPMVANNGFTYLPDDMTCLRFDGRGRVNLLHTIAESDQPSAQTDGITVVVVAMPERVWSGQPGYNQYGQFAAFDLKYYTNNQTYTGIESYGGKPKGTSYVPGRLGRGPGISEYGYPSPVGYFMERNAFGVTDEYGENGAPGSYFMSGYVQDWNLVHEKQDNTTSVTRLDCSTYKDYELYNQPPENCKYQTIMIGGAPQGRHTSHIYTRGRLYEVFMFDTLLDQTDRTTLVQYIQDRYDINNARSVGDECVRLPYGEEIHMRNIGEGLSIPVERNMYKGDSCTVNLWVRFNGMRDNAPGARYNNNITHPGPNTNTYGTVFQESTYRNKIGSGIQYGRATLYGAFPSGKDIYLYLANQSHRIGNIVNNRWYHFKWLITDYANEPSNSRWDYAMLVDGNRVRKHYTTNYRYFTPQQVVMGVGPSTGKAGDATGSLNYEVPTTRYTTNTKREDQTSMTRDDPSKCANEFVMDVAGYSVVMNELTGMQEFEDNYDSGLITSTQWQDMYDDIALSAKRLDEPLYKAGEKPADTSDKSSSQPAVDPQTLGGWQYMKAMYNPRPPLSVLGTTQWGSTNSVWNGTLSLASRQIHGDLSFMNYSTVAKTFKNTNLTLNSNNITDVTGLENLASVTGAGGDTDTSRTNLTMQYNRIKSLTPLKYSSYTANKQFNDVNLSYNLLENLDGLQNAHERHHYRTISYANNNITNIDALAETSFYRAGGFDLKYNYIDFTPGVYPFANWQGYGGIDLTYNNITDLRYASNSATDYIYLGSQYNNKYTYRPIEGLDELWMPRTYYIGLQNNVFSSTTLSDVNIENRFNRLDALDIAGTNLEDISALAKLTIEARNNAPDQVTTPYTGRVYGGNTPEFAYSDGFSAKDIACFQYLNCSWSRPVIDSNDNTFLRKEKRYGGNIDYYPVTYPWEQTTETPTYRTTSLDRTNGFTQRYNEGYRIYVSGYLRFNYTPIHDLRIFKYAFHGINAWYSPSYHNHYADFVYCDMPDGPNTTGVMKNWSKQQKLYLYGNRINTLDDMFVDSGFHDSPEADARSFWQSRRSFEYLYLNYNNISDLSFMLKTNFAGVKYLFLSNNPVTYDEVDRIADDLITLKQNGEIDLVQVDMYLTTWDREHMGLNRGYWDNTAYYPAWNGNNPQYRSGPGGWYTHPLSASGTDSALYCKRTRTKGWQGWKFEDGYTDEALLRKRLLDAGINFRFHFNYNDHVQGLGDSATWPTGSADWNSYMKNYVNHYRWGHDREDGAGRLQLTQSDTTENTSNELTLTISNSMDMYPGDTITLYGHGNSFKSLPMASNNSYPVGGTLGAVFGGSGVWNKTDGTLKLTVAAGQTMTHQQLYELKWTITNPSYDDDITNGHADYSNNKFTSGRRVYVSAEDRFGNNRTDDHTYYTGELFGPTTQ